MIIDFHTHAFPDRIACNALASLSANAEVYGPYTDGTVSGLIRSMDNAGIDISVIANIATNPQQNKAIQKWSEEIRSDRIVPLGSVHPDSPRVMQ